MDAGSDTSPTADAPSEREAAAWRRPAIWVAAMVAAALVALAFGAYRQPELLLNLLGLRYCG